MEKAAIHGIREIKVRLYRVRILAARSARLVTVPDRHWRHELDAGSDGLLVGAVVELVLQGPDARSFPGAQAVQDAGTLRREKGEAWIRLAREQVWIADDGDAGIREVESQGAEDRGILVADLLDCGLVPTMNL